MKLTAQTIRRARNGDKEAVREVMLSARSLAEGAYRSLVQDICKKAAQICLDDLLQDLAVKLQEQREKWPLYFRPWLLCVWRNFLIDRYRAVASECRIRVDASLERYQDDEVTNPGLILDVEMACDSLTELQHEAIFHVHWQGMTYEEAAEALNTTEPSIRGRISRGYDRVRKSLSEYGPLFDRP